MKQPFAIVSMGYWFRIAVSLDKLQDTVKLLSNMTPVDVDWIDGQNVYFRKDTGAKISIDIVDEVLDKRPEPVIAPDAGDTEDQKAA